MYYEYIVGLTHCPSSRLASVYLPGVRFILPTMLILMMTLEALLLDIQELLNALPLLTNAK